MPAIIVDYTQVKGPQKASTHRKAAHAVFMYDASDKKDEKRVNTIVNETDKLKIKTVPISASGSGKLTEKREAILIALQQQVDDGIIADDTQIFIQSHTRSDSVSNSLYFSFKTNGPSVHLPVEALFACVWSRFPGDKKPSFHILGCNSGFHAEKLKNAPGRVFCHAGKGTMTSRAGFSQAAEVLRFMSEEVYHHDLVPTAENIWDHMRNYALLDMEITGNGNYSFHAPATLPSWSTTRKADDSSHKNPKALFEFALRYRPYSEVDQLVKTRDPELKILGTLNEAAKKRILGSLVPNHVEWTNYPPDNSYNTITERDHKDSASKFLFCLEKGLLPILTEKESDDFLFKVCREGFSELAKIILDRKIFFFSERGKQAALREAIKAGNTPLVSKLLDHVSITVQADDDMDTLLHEACRGDNPDILAMILGTRGLGIFPADPQRSSANPSAQLLDQRNRAGQSPLDIAIASDNADAVNTLLAAGANPNTENTKGTTPLQRAILRNNIHIANILLNHSAAIKRRSKDTEPLLYKVARRGQHDMAQLLISHLRRRFDFDEIEAKNSKGMTPLLLAVQKNDPVMLDILLDAGAYPLTKDHSGKNALHFLASISLHKAEKQKPAKKMKSGQQSSHLPSTDPTLRKIRMTALTESLTGLQLPLDERDSKGNTPLITAAKNGHTRICLHLLDLDANPNLQNKEGYTALHYALQSKNGLLVDQLLSVTDLQSEQLNLKKALDLALVADHSNAIWKLSQAIEARRR